LIDRGYLRVRPLHGGLDAWADAGYKVEGVGHSAAKNEKVKS
jgi:rhodanese-related sulfurtransferase